MLNVVYSAVFADSDGQVYQKGVISDLTDGE